MGSKFYNLFQVKKPIIGMIHLAGKGENEKIERALEELRIFEEEGVNGAIVENYHGTVKDLINVFRETSKINYNLILGVNVLGTPYSGFPLAERFGAKFVQFDSVQAQDIDGEFYNELRETYQDILVLGGIRFKYTKPTNNSLEEDLIEGMSKCEAIVTTGEGTGIETPISKLMEFKSLIRNFPLITGAGITRQNVKMQLSIADGAIVGSFFKDKDTHDKIKRERVKELMTEVNFLRENIY